MMMSHLPMPSTSDAIRWRAVQSRDRSADGRFVYAVSSTGIYCRPSCPSRRPRRERVAFFPDAESARRAGYRACRRCRPDQAATGTAQKVELAKRWIDSHPDDRVSLARLGRVTGASPWHLQRTFKELLGLTPREYALAQKTTRLKHELRRTSVTDAIYAAGFSSPSRAYESAPAILGMTPRSYRAGGKGQQIRFDVVPTALGVILVAATPRGLCHVAIGEDPAELERRLRDEFPAAEVTRDRVALRPLASALRAAASGRSLATLPMDVRATDFQRRVWRALQAIPPGETRTYGQVARVVGAPSGARAVARACATNPLALAVPCHRVVAASGDTGGYRWGSERKKKLLRMERALSPK
jgi:AraC family transcriptional regulator, regulatory protein of adaptative response / methylated-DNA-[protein]-cysteine methyltransferase